MRKRTTILLDSELLTAAAALAKATGRNTSDILEDALRRYLPAAAEVPDTQKQPEVPTETGEPAGLTDEQALAMAYEELHALRQSRRSA